MGTETCRQYSITGNVVIMVSGIEQLNKTFHSQLPVSVKVIKTMHPLNLNTQCYPGIDMKGFDKPVCI